MSYFFNSRKVVFVEKIVKEYKATVVELLKKVIK